MSMSKPQVKEITVVAFNKLISGKRPFMVKFWSPLCGHCERFAPVVDAVAEALAGELLVVALNVEEADKAQAAEEYRVNMLPALLLVKDGKLSLQLGTDTKRGVLEWVQKEMKG